MQIPEDLKRYTETCVQGGSPPCTCHCPFGFDIKKFLKKIEAGNFRSAYKDYRDRVVFPAIVNRICEAPCSRFCPADLRMPLLERACVEFAENREPQRYSLPKREGRVAVIGAGLSGLACALRLAAKKYDVTVFERESQIGGGLIDVLPAEIYLPELEMQFTGVAYDLRLNVRIDSLEDLAWQSGGSFDAVYVATGLSGTDFGLRSGLKTQTESTEAIASAGRMALPAGEGIFIGGRALGGSRVDALACGIAAARSIETWIKIRSMDHNAQDGYIYDCRMKPYENKEENVPVEPEEGFSYTKGEAITEAGRCLKCDCTICYDTCPFMQQQRLMPKEVELKALSGREATNERIGNRMIASCTLCGHCAAVCDYGADLEKTLVRAKRKLFEDGGFAPAYHDFYMRDFEDAMGPSYLCLDPPDGKNAKYVFFPGCQSGVTNPEYVQAPYRYLQNKEENTALLLACCGVPALYAGDHASMRRCQDKLRAEFRRLGDPVVILSCPNCMKTFAEYMPDIRFTSLFEYALEAGLRSETVKSAGDGQPDLPGRFTTARPLVDCTQEAVFALFDPCASRGFPAVQEAVRLLLEKTDASYEELPNNRAQALCCGAGGHIYAANPALSKRFTEVASEASSLPYVAWCVNCRDMFLAAGKPVVYLLDLLFDLTALEQPVHLYERTQNRKNLIRQLHGENVKDDGKWKTPADLEIRIPEDVLTKMDTRLLSADEVVRVVADAEAGKTWLSRDNGNIRIASAPIELLTVWVEYKVSDTCAELCNVYCHRIRFESGTGR